MNISLRNRPQNIGREDRLVRACVALSLLLLGGFSVMSAGDLPTVVIGFALGLGYFALTAAVAWDPFYASQGIDTRPEVPHEADPLIDADPFARTEHGDWPQRTGGIGYVSVLDLTDGADARADGTPPVLGTPPALSTPTEA
jgi:hypothetical protein